MDETPKSAADAFEELRQEVGLMRLALQRSVDEQIIVPDYSETLGRMSQDVGEASETLKWLVGQPAVQTTADQMARAIGHAGSQALSQHREAVQDAARSLARATSEIDGYIARSIIAGEQKRNLWQVGLRALGGGIVLGAFLVTGLLHLAPEHGAAWILGLDRWDAGERLMVSADQNRWSHIQDLMRSEQDNCRTLETRRTKSYSLDKKRWCQIIVKARPTPMRNAPASTDK